MKQQRQSLIYTILADDMPIAAIEATGPEARELCKERWSIEELTQLKWMGQPLYRPGVHLRARAATEDEWVIYDKEARAAKAPEDIMFVYLVDLDRQ
jgi:hypothetical protein